MTQIAGEAGAFQTYPEQMLAQKAGILPALIAKQYCRRFMGNLFSNELN
jgi:hypothetical protein